jgi:hypothetical protein
MQQSREGHASNIPLRKYLTSMSVLDASLAAGVGNSVFADSDLPASGEPDHIIPFGGTKNLMVIPFGTQTGGTPSVETLTIRLTLWDFMDLAATDEASSKLWIPSEVVEGLFTLGSRAPTTLALTANDDVVAASTFFTDTAAASSQFESPIQTVGGTLGISAPQVSDLNGVTLTGTGGIVDTTPAALTLANSKGFYGWSLAFEKETAGSCNALYRMF